MFSLIKKYRPEDVAICTVHGNSEYYNGEFAKKYAWPKLQIQQLRKYTPKGFKVFACGNNLINEHEDYLKACPEVEYFSNHDICNTHTQPLSLDDKSQFVWPLRNWLTRQAIKNHKVLIHLDSDAFPVKENWLHYYSKKLTKKSPVVAVQRLENGDTHSDRCFLMFSKQGFLNHAFDFSNINVVDVGGGISQHLEDSGYIWTSLNRSNKFDYHPVIAAIYDENIYHHGAGSRLPKLRQNNKLIKNYDFFENEKKLHRDLMIRVFEDTDNFLAELRGHNEPQED